MCRIVIISGLSGSGKSVALNAFEDLGFYAIDNLPIKLFSKFRDLVQGTNEYRQVAMVMDNRDIHFAESYREVLENELKLSNKTDLLFLEADDKTLLKRFSETRRRHPLSKESVEEGIAKEKELLIDLKNYATDIIDTSSMDVHRLRKSIFERYSLTTASKMQVQFVSFGFKHGTPPNCDLLIDVRFFSNPHFDPELRPKTGTDKVVQEAIRSDDRFDEFIQKSVDYLRFLIPQYQAEGKSYLKVGIGCTGGRHRSVFIAETLSQQLNESLALDPAARVEHAHIRL